MLFCNLKYCKYLNNLTFIFVYVTEITMPEFIKTICDSDINENEWTVLMTLNRNMYDTAPILKYLTFNLIDSASRFVFKFIEETWECKDILFRSLRHNVEI